MRIVGGRWRRTPLAVADRNGLRPTPERVRETVFDWLGHLLGSFSGKSVLYLFAGSGALGFEALSRGMKAADFVERDSRQAALLKQAAAKLSEKEADDIQIRVHQGDAFEFLKGTASCYDVIFIDPPYALDMQDKAIVEAAKCLGPNGVLYVERSGVLTSPEVLEQQKLVRLRSMSAGQVTLQLVLWLPWPKPRSRFAVKRRRLPLSRHRRRLKVKFNALIASLTSDQLWLMHGQD